MTLVGVLAATAIIAATVATLTPLTVDARASGERSDAALRLRAVLSSLAPQKTPLANAPILLSPMAAAYSGATLCPLSH